MLMLKRNIKYIMQLQTLLPLPLYIKERRHGTTTYIDYVDKSVIDPVDDIDINSYTYNKTEHLRYILDKHGDMSAKVYARFLQIQNYFNRITKDAGYFSYEQQKQFTRIAKRLCKRTMKLRKHMLHPATKSNKWYIPDTLLHRLKKTFIRAQFDEFTIMFIENYAGGILYLINAINRTTKDVISANDLAQYDYIADLDKFINWFKSVSF